MALLHCAQMYVTSKLRLVDSYVTLPSSQISLHFTSETPCALLAWPYRSFQRVVRG